MTAVWLLLACSQDPVLVGLAEEEVLQAEEASGPVRYEKGEGVLVDVAYLGGRAWDEVRGEVELQMGQIQERVERGRDGVEIRLDRGMIRVVDQQVQLLRVELPYAMRRSQALENLGLPPQVREWHGNERDWVTHHNFGFERIRMGRDEPDSELVVWVEARKFNPRRR
ncbi:MAG: hypothetical protein VXW32_16365 [Myxococcota bacterium]|nr:hypothetical protein [Myxococcota bacterium]